MPTVHQPPADPASIALRVLTEIVGFTTEEIRAFGPCPVVTALDAP